MTPTFVRQVLAEVDGRYLSVYDGLTEYRVGVTVRPGGRCRPRELSVCPVVDAA